jgi:hypothetical protein
MPRSHAPRRRPLLSSVLVFALVSAAAVLVLAAQSAGAGPVERPRSASDGALPQVPSLSGAALDRRATEPFDAREERRAGQWLGAVRRATESSTHVRPSPNQGTTVRPALEPVARTSIDGPGTVSRFHGRNHVWIPSLGIDRSVSAFPCSRTRPPDNYVYRWGCAGKNNVYLLGHAYSVFEPLHDAYVNGTLRKGMEVVYADGSGRVRTYAVSWWRVTAPTSAASWAWAPQSRPSMTLQTCVGADSQYRLIVRLVARD